MNVKSLYSNISSQEGTKAVRKTLSYQSDHSHKKRKDSLEGSLDRVLLAAELEFLKILVPRLLQHTSDVNIECAGKSEWSKRQCSLHVTSFLEH